MNKSKRFDTHLNPTSKSVGVSPRAVLIGLVCAAGECLIAPYNDYVIRNVFLAGGHFPVGPFFVLTYSGADWQPHLERSFSQTHTLGG